jgi:ParB/RepB/Spo0J family partition protein
MTTPELQAKPNGHAPPQAVPAALTAAIAAADDAEEMNVLLAHIDPDPDQPRKYFSDEDLHALVDSLATHGQQVAGIAYRDPETGRYRIIEGERRFRALLRLGAKTMRLRVFKQPPDQLKRSQLQLISFDQHKDLTLVERDMAYEDHITRVGGTATALAQVVGKSISAVTRAIQRAQAIAPALKERFRAGTLPPEILEELATLPGDAQLALAEQYPNTLRNKAEVKAAVRAARDGQAAAGASSFTCQDQEADVKISVSFSGQDLSRVEAVVRQLAKDLGANSYRGLEKFKEFLNKKARAAKKAIELKAAQEALAGLTNPAPERNATHG